MPKFKFVGAEPVDVPSLGLVDVQPGDVIDGPDGLSGQSQWEPVPEKAKKV